VDSVDTVILQVQPSPDDTNEEVAKATQRLRAVLLELDLASVDPLADPSIPDGAKGLETVIGWLAVRFGKEGVRAVVGAVVSWATRTGHNVEVTMDGDTLKVSGVTSEQQDRIVNDFLARHAAGA
jgi:hypothetical protein